MQVRNSAETPMSPDGAGIDGLAVFSRFVNPEGRISDRAAEAGRLAKAMSRLAADAGLEHVLTLAGDLVVEDLPPQSRLLAIVGIGIGRAPVDGTDALWVKGKFGPHEYLRWPAKAPDSRGGQFRANEEGPAGIGQNNPPTEVPPDIEHNNPLLEVAAAAVPPGIGHNNPPTEVPPAEVRPGIGHNNPPDKVPGVEVRLSNPPTETPPAEVRPGIGHNNPPPDAPPVEAPPGIGHNNPPAEVLAGEIEQKITDRVRRTALRRALRVGLRATLRIGAEAAASIIPGIGTVAEVIMLIDLAQTAAEFDQLKIDADAGVDFAMRGPRTLDELRMGTEPESFSSYDAFRKDILGKRFGPAGDGYEYHHIVEQSSIRGGNTTSDQIQNTDNIVRIPRLLHEIISAEYSEPSEVPGLTIRQWLRTQSYEDQRNSGIKMMRDLNILK